MTAKPAMRQNIEKSATSARLDWRETTAWRIVWPLLLACAFVLLTGVVDGGVGEIGRAHV